MWDKEPCLSCPVANAPAATVSELLKKLETCAACGKANGEGGAEAALEAALCAAVFGTMKRTVSDKKKKEKSKA